jgi:exopolysaccharide biosynthesis polyprenyl glycosylphosphotransferase
MALDMAAVGVGWAAAFLVGTGGSTDTSARIVYVGLAMVAALYLHGRFGLYSGRVSSVRSVETAAVGRSSLLVAAAVLLVAQLADRPIGLGEAGLAVVITFFGVVAVRGGFDYWLRAQRRQGHYTRPTILIGSGTETLELYELLADTPELGYRIIGVFGAENIPALLERQVPWLGRFDQAADRGVLAGATGAIVAADGLDPETRRTLVTELIQAGMYVHLSVGCLGMSAQRMEIAPVNHEALLHVSPEDRPAFESMLKRSIDLLASIITIALALPLLIVLALAVKFSSPGPVLYRQVRVGLDGRLFTMFKFRTMSADADSRLDDLQEKNQRSGPLFKLADDPRVTRVGRFLRVTSLDELPQLFNVVRGEMSIVGPRPAMPNEVARFDDELLGRLAVKPGITGLWQVEARENPAFGPYRRLDLYYARNWSTSLDLSIMVLTIPAVGIRSLQAATKLIRRKSPSHGTPALLD